MQLLKSSQEPLINEGSADRPSSLPVSLLTVARCSRSHLGLSWNLHLEFAADYGRMTGYSSTIRLGKTCRPSGVDQERYFFWFSITANPQDQAADAWGCRSFAPMKMSHSMMASSPNITGKTQLETLCSYCGHNMPVTLVAR